MKYIDYLINGKNFDYLNKIYPFTNYCNIKTNQKINKYQCFNNKINPSKDTKCILQKRFYTKNFDFNDDLKPLTDKEFINIKQYTTKSTNLITLNENKYLPFIKNMVMHGFVLYDQACYFQNSVNLILNLFKIRPPEELITTEKSNYRENLKKILKETHTNEKKINKLIDFYNIITNYNDTYLLTKLYYFLLENGYDKYLKYIGIPGDFSIEPGFILTIFLKILNQIDINIFNLCGLNLKNGSNVFMYNIDEPDEMKSYIITLIDSYNNGEKKDYLYNENLFGGKAKIGENFIKGYNDITKLNLKDIQPEEYLNDIPKEKIIVKLENYLEYDYENILDLTGEIINTPEILIININTLLNNFLNISNKDIIFNNKNFKLYYDIFENYKKKYDNRYCNQIYYDDEDNQIYIFNRLYLSNKFIKINNIYYKLEMYLENTNFVHTSFIINNDEFKNKYDYNYSTLNYNYLYKNFKIQPTVVPIIYVYKKCNEIDLNKNVVIERIEPEIPKKNILNDLNKKIDKDLLYNFISGNLSYDLLIKNEYYNKIFEYFIKLYDIYLNIIIINNKKEYSISSFKSYIDDIKKLFKDYKLKYSKDKFLFNYLINNSKILNEIFLLIFYYNKYSIKKNINELIDDEFMLLLDYDKINEQTQKQTYDFLKDLQ